MIVELADSAIQLLVDSPSGTRWISIAEQAQHYRPGVYPSDTMMSQLQAYVLLTLTPHYYWFIADSNEWSCNCNRTVLSNVLSR